MSKGPGKQCPTFPQCRSSADGRLLNDTNMSDDTSLPGEEELWMIILSNFVSPVIYGVAIVGNCLGLGVVWNARQTKKLSAYTYLFSLTLSDVMYLVVNAGRLARSLYKRTGSASGLLRTSLIYFDNVFAQTSMAIIIVMCIERLIVLIKPLKAKNMLFSRHPWKIIGVCFFINIFTSLMGSIFAKYPQLSYMSANTTINRTTESSSTTDETISIILILNESVLNFICPVILLIFTSIAIAVAYCRLVNHQRTILKLKRSSISDNQNKATLTVFIIAVMYLLSLIPRLVYEVFENIGDEFSKFGIHRNINKSLKSVAQLMSLINAANDFIIFILVSNNNRQLFKDMYCKRLMRNSPSTDPTVPAIVDTINLASETSKHKSSECITTLSETNGSRPE